MREAAVEGGDFDRAPATTTENDVGSGDDGERVLEWEVGLPSAEDLPSLSQSLLSPELAHAFRIKPEPCRTLLELHRASQSSFEGLRRAAVAVPLSSSTSAANPIPPFQTTIGSDGDDLSGNDGMAAESSSHPLENEDDDDPSASRNTKRPRLVWTPQLHKRFVDVVEHLGVKKAVPKTIMQLMNVEGLTRENVASHLQKFRQYLKRTHDGTPGEDQSPPDPLFSSSPPPPANHRDQPPPAVATPVPYTFPNMIPMPVFGMPHHGPIGIAPFNNSHQGSGNACHGSENSEQRLQFNGGGFSAGRPSWW